MRSLFFNVLLAGVLQARLIEQNEEEKTVDFIRKKAEKDGIGFESHEVITDDGYILQVFHLFSP